MNSIKYFNDNVENYDKKLKKPFWSLCDDILAILLKQCLSKQFKPTDKFSVLDLGCGTGKWSLFIKQNFPNAEITLLDGANLMLIRAKENLRDYDNIASINADLEGNWISAFSDSQKFDVIICIYVAMFISNNNFLSGIEKLLSKNGIFFLITQTKRQIQKLLVLQGKMDLAYSVESNQSQFIIDNFPKMNFWDSNRIKSVCSKLKVKYENTFPNFAQNGIREKMTGENLSIGDTLRTNNNYEDILEFEIKHLMKNVYRSGMYIFMEMSKNE